MHNINTDTKQIKTLSVTSTLNSEAIQTAYSGIIPASHSTAFFTCLLNILAGAKNYYKADINLITI